MGFFKKIVKGVGKIFKSIGKGIKSVFKKVGKFMGKIGIVGQLGLMLIAPYAMPMLGSFATSMMGSTMGGAFGSIVRGAGQFLNAAVKVGTRVGQVFKSVTKAVTGTLKNTIGFTLKKAGLGDFVQNISGWDVGSLDFDTAFEESGKLWSNAGDDLGQLFSKSTLDSSMNSFGIEKNLNESFAKLEERGFDLDNPDVQKSLQDAGITESYDVPSLKELGLPEPNTNAFPAKSGLEYSEMVTGRPTPELLPQYTDPSSVFPSTTPAPTESLLRPPLQAAGNIQPPAPSGIELNLDNYVFDSKPPLPGGETLELSQKIQDGVKTSYEANAWEKTKAFAEAKGLPTTAGGVAMQAAELAAYEPPTYEDKVTPLDYVDYSSLQAQPIYPTSDGLRYGNMLTPDPFDAPSLIDALMQGDFNSAYQYGYYGSPALIREMMR
jgi:hypothetical protein